MCSPSHFPVLSAGQNGRKGKERGPNNQKKKRKERKEKNAQSRETYISMLIVSYRKFGKQIQRRQLDLPEYAASFVNYKALKKVPHLERFWLLQGSHITTAYKTTECDAHNPRPERYGCCPACTRIASRASREQGGVLLPTGMG